ncbi:hypothetical protein JZ751_011009 [Albula glossodonta]|uniref:Uncharacterized protein n=1 Tax=Albula glossodonta TaxID=121402 RepID=A0A8T2NY91_9TELE|nr:hypothetical protein JZ751_011009 [Albula glossodonta]
MEEEDGVTVSGFHIRPEHRGEDWGLPLRIRTDLCTSNRGSMQLASEERWIQQRLRSALSFL